MEIPTRFKAAKTSRAFFESQFVASPQLTLQKNYSHYIRKYILFHKKRHPLELAEIEIDEYLSYLAVKRRVSGFTQNQAFSGILFLFREILGREIGDHWKNNLGQESKRLPEVFS